MTLESTRDIIQDGIADAPIGDSVVKPYVMSHGTLEVFSLKESRKFYEEFLGLECVRHSPPAMLFRCGLKFHVVCMEVGDDLEPRNLLSHWGLDVRTREEVDTAHADAVRLKDRYGIRQIMDLTDQHGAYGFYFEDRDHNWWEIQHIDGFVHDDVYDFGDRFDPDGKPLGVLKKD